MPNAVAMKGASAPAFISVAPGPHRRPALSPQGFRVVDVWQSEEACDRFGETLGPILQEVGVEDQPETYEAHAFVWRDAFAP